MVPVAQETTANTVRLPYSFSRRFSLVAWCEASLEILHVGLSLMPHTAQPVLPAQNQALPPEVRAFLNAGRTR
ncbi:hypothetical protein NZ034_03185 [Escherichia coli]|uniref:hypothetical protein n=1 Tax=Escherichia coli TaxID=562 RepID=UPI00217F5533|nr:hypothetical protein [Escherichia coli]MCS7429731.1 hypothetical protein [Escherichia coli]